jgi:hypothetical protein
MATTQTATPSAPEFRTPPTGYFKICYDTLAVFLKSSDKAAFVQHLDFWHKNESTGYPMNDGRKWIMNGYKEWAKNFPWLTTANIGRIVRYLEKIGWVITKRFYDLKRNVGFVHKCPDLHEDNQRKWYCLDYQKIYDDTGFDLLFAKENSEPTSEPNRRKRSPRANVPKQDIAMYQNQTLQCTENAQSSYKENPKKTTDFKEEEVCVGSEKLLDEEPECEQRSGFCFKNFENETNQDAIPGSPTTLLNNTENSGVVDITSNGGQGSAAPISNTEIGQVANKTSDEGQGFAPIGCKKDEPSQDAINQSLSTLLGEVEPLQVANKTSSEGQGFAPPIRKTSQKEKWVCPGTDAQRDEFLRMKGELLVKAKKCESVESRTAALAWANHNPESANLLWEDWQQELKRKQANQNSSLKTVPEFHRMSSEEHASLLEIFMNVGGEAFIALSYSHKYWLDFATTLRGQKLIDGLSPEIVKQIRKVLRCTT